MTVSECIAWVESHMEVKYATANGAYQAGRKINPQGCVNHSVGCAQPSVDVFFNIMNKSSAGWGVNALLGDFHKGDGRILVVLPLDARPWGCGSGSKGSWNNTKVQWEVCEPAGHTYAGGTMIAYDVAKNQVYFDRMWKMLVAWNVYLVKKFGYDINGISDHAESYRAGYGSNHSDMGQWLPKHGKSMAALRQEVEAIIGGNSASEITVSYQGRVTANDGLNCRTYPVNGDILITYPKDTIVSITQEKNGWGYTGAGWVSLAYIERINTPSSETEDDDMDVKRFEELFLEMRKGLQDNDAGTYSNEARNWATSSGLIAGNGTEINGEPNCMWQDFLTREQFVTVLYRFAQMMGKS